jgi:predicted Zn-dependent protease
MMLRDIRHRLATALLAAGLALLAAPVRGQAVPDPATSLAAQAEAARAADRPGEAIALYRRALQARPRWAEGWFHLGTLLYDGDAHAEAAAALRTATALDPSVGTAWVMLGLCEYRLGALADALEHVQKGRRLGVSADPQFRLVMRYHEGLLLVHAAEFERAQEVLDELGAEGVDTADLDVAQGLAALRMRPGELPPGGLAAGDSPLRTLVIAAGRAEGLFARHQLADAQRAFEALAADHPATRNVHYALGRFFVRTEQPAPATAAFEREIAISPDHVPARLGLAAIVMQDDPARALRLVDEAIARNPHVPLAHYLRGRLLLDRGDAAGAVPALETAERSVKDDPGVYYALSRAYAQLGRTADADRARATFTRLNEARQAAARRTPGG